MRYQLLSINLHWGLRRASQIFNAESWKSAPGIAALVVPAFHYILSIYNFVLTCTAYGRCAMSADNSLRS